MSKSVYGFAKWYCKIHEVKLKVVSSRLYMDAAGLVFFGNRTIFIDKTIGVDLFLTTLFHEIAHIKCHDLGIFPNYNRDDYFGRGYKKRILLLRQQAYRAECKVDEMAKKEMKIYFPQIKYKTAYAGNPKDSKKWLLEYFADT